MKPSRGLKRCHLAAWQLLACFKDGVCCVYLVVVSYWNYTWTLVGLILWLSSILLLLLTNFEKIPFDSIQKCSSSRPLSNMSYVRPKQTQYGHNYIHVRFSVKSWYLIIRGKSSLRVYENRVLRRICGSESWRSWRMETVSQWWTLPSIRMLLDRIFRR
jgi:hypothetical protein